MYRGSMLNARTAFIAFMGFMGTAFIAFIAFMGFEALAGCFCGVEAAFIAFIGVRIAPSSTCKTKACATYAYAKLTSTLHAAL